jgi:hypothetical protein
MKEGKMTIFYLIQKDKKRAWRDSMDPVKSQKVGSAPGKWV